MNIEYSIEKEVADDGTITFTTKATGVDGREFVEPLYTKQVFEPTFADAVNDFDTHAERNAVLAMEQAIENAGEDAFG